jgi:hypothetical protein
VFPALQAKRHDSPREPGKSEHEWRKNQRKMIRLAQQVRQRS